MITCPISKSVSDKLVEKYSFLKSITFECKEKDNKSIYMDACVVCGSSDRLESHHINMQKDFVSGINGQINKNKKHVVKDSTANLIVLCSKCHDNLHSGNFTISGLVKSSSGVKPI